MLEGRIADIAPDQSMLKYFDGRVEIKKMVTDATSKEVEAYVVTFFAGARTKLHYHETDQILIATAGKGVVAIQSKVEMQDGTAKISMEEYVLEEGGFVCVPAYVWHWHGAQKGTDFAHMQVKKPGKTAWLEQ
jgi:quercetin dioxygenase-like cupin family protein